MSSESELVYLNELKSIIEKNNVRENRTEIETLGKNGIRFVYDLTCDCIPILTTRKMNWRGVVKELLWIISGSTDANILTLQGVHIWEKHTSREFLDSQGLDYDVGDIGPYIGYQWRHFGAEYHGKNKDYTNKGKDQLKELIETIRDEPTSRRLILTSWNPLDTKKTPLPPCVILVQFIVNNGELDCFVTQRSADMALGFPWNFTSYAIFTIMIAHITGLKAGTLFYNIADAHIYICHVEALTELIKRNTHQSPMLFFQRKINDIDDFKLNDFKLYNYNHEPGLNMTMVV